MRHLHHRLPERRTWRPEIAGMCAAAARRVRAGEDGAAQFSLLSDDEARLAREEMASHYPDVLFTVTMALPRTCGASAWTAEMALNGGVPADLRAGAAPAQAQRDGAPVQQPDGAD